MRRKPWAGYKNRTRKPNRAERRDARYFQWQLDRAREEAKEWAYMLKDEEKS